MHALAVSGWQICCSPSRCERVERTQLQYWVERTQLQYWVERTQLQYWVERTQLLLFD